MTSKQRLLIKKKLACLRKIHASELDMNEQQKHHREIAALENQLRQEAPSAEERYSTNISDIEAGGDITIGDHINHHHHYSQTQQSSPKVKQEKQRSFLPYAVLFLLGTILLVNYFSSSFFPNTVSQDPGSSDTATITMDTVHTPAQASTPSTAHSSTPTSPQKKKGPVLKKFRILSDSPLVRELLKTALEKDPQYQEGKGSEGSLTILVEGSGSFTEVHGQYVRYSGGYVKVKVNGKICCCPDKLPIELHDSKQGNLKHVAQQELDEQIDQLIEKNLDHVISKIKACGI